MNLQAEERKLIKSFVFPALIVGLMWLVKGAETVFDFSAGQLGIRPLEASGLAGILLSPFIHGDWNHLFANSIPMLVLPAALFYFYRTLAFRILLFTTLICGFWVWAGAREASHIGASGVIYGLASFLMVSGFLRKENRLMALSLVVVFLYGSFIWGIFPELFPEKNISWESHLSGLLTGLLLAFFFRKEGPQRPTFTWEEEDESDMEPEKQEETEKEYWNVPEPDRNDLTVVYRFRKKE
jgi:membrane associated rhomboid family serine protease